jgi:cellobiose dehydrogenase (acceptor)
LLITRTLVFTDQGKLTCENYTNAFVGCAVGGSSAINAGIFFQPPASDFDLYFPDGWKSKDVNASIGKVLSTVPAGDVYSKNQLFYAQSGFYAAQNWLVTNAGYKEVDFNAHANDKSKVFGRPIFDYNGGQRGGPATTYLQDALKNNNFTLQINTRVKRVARNGTLATGVIAIVNGTEKTVKLANGGRVVLSSGAIQSPQILMYSGIGDPAIRSNLTAGGILDGVNDWINNTAVGDGLFDNPNTFIEFEGPGLQSYVYNYTNPIQSDANLYVEDRSGPYAFASETSAFWDYVNHTDGTQTGCQGTIDSAGFADWMAPDTITLNVYGTSGMRSRGKVILDEKYLPGPSPDVYYSDPQDVEDIATFIRSIYDGINSTALTPKNLPLNYTQAQIRDYLNSTTAYTRGEVQHWSSSCKIGACVDVNTQVKGTNNIHVVDASIVEPLTVNPQVRFPTQLHNRLPTS